MIRKLATVRAVKFDVADKDGETPEDVAENGKVKKLLQQLAAARENEEEDDAAGADAGEGDEGDDE